MQISFITELILLFSILWKDYTFSMWNSKSLIVKWLTGAFAN